MRRKVTNRKPVDPDAKYSSVLVAQIINKLMQAGKKTIAERIVYGALEQAEKQIKKPALEVLDAAMENAGPKVELRSRRIGGANYQVPYEITQERRMTLAVRWIIMSARGVKGKPMQQKLAEEIINAVNNTGNAVKKKLDTHRMAEANKAFAHFRW